MKRTLALILVTALVGAETRAADQFVRALKERTIGGQVRWKF